MADKEVDAPGLWDPTRSEYDQGPRQSVASLTTLATIVTVCAILYVAKDLFLPLALGMLIAFILTPVVNFLRRQGLRDMFAVILTVLAAAALIGMFVLILAYQVSQIGANIPQYQGNVLSKIDSLLDAGEDSRVLSHLQGMIENISNRLALETGAPGDEAMKVEVVEHTGMRCLRWRSSAWCSSLSFLP
jgi:predicted PurR-regulated permease PerM